MIGTYPIGATRSIGSFLPPDSAIAGEAVFNFSSAPFQSLPNDDPANHFFDPRLTTALSMSRSIRHADLVAAGVGRSSARIEIQNPDGAYDGLGAAYSMNGRDARVRSVAPGASLATAQTVMDGAVLSSSFDDKKIELAIRTRDVRLDQPLQPDLYDGDGGLEGGEDLAGKNKPQAFGEVYNIEPVLLGVVGGFFKYHVGGPIEDVFGFFDRGVALDKVTSTPSVGEYSVDLTNGVISHGGIPTGLITANVKGYKPAGGVYDPTVHGILTNILRGFGDIDELDVVAFDRLKTETLNKTSGIWFGAEDVTIREAVDRVLVGSAAFGGFNREGRFAPQRLVNPGGAVRVRFDETNILTFQRISPPAIINPPTHRIKVGWRRNYSVFNDAPSGATDAQRAFMAVQYREVMRQDSSIKLKHRGSKPFFYPTVLVNMEDAEAEADRLLTLYGVDRNIWSIGSRGVSLDLDLGDTVEITYPRFSLTKKIGTVIALAIDLETGSSTIEVFA